MAQAPTAGTKKAAIDLDDIQEKSLSDVSAADFLSALSNSGVKGLTVMRIWPEKKKLELLLEPEFSPTITVGRLVDRLTEKKKYSLRNRYLLKFINVSARRVSGSTLGRSWLTL